MFSQIPRGMAEVNIGVVAAAVVVSAVPAVNMKTCIGLEIIKSNLNPC